MRMDMEEVEERADIIGRLDLDIILTQFSGDQLQLQLAHRPARQSL